MTILITLCLLLNNNYSPYRLRWVEKEFKRVGIEISLKDVCTPENTVRAYFSDVAEWAGPAVGRATIDSYGNFEGSIWVVSYHPFLDYKVEWVYITKREEAKRLNNITTHELGHCLGLRHSTNKRSVMYPSHLVNRTSPRQKFLKSDIRKLVNLYKQHRKRN